MGKCRSTSIPPLINPNTNEISVGEKEKADLLNSYFCNISTSSDDGVTPPDLLLRTQHSLDIDEITEDEIKDILKSLEIGKASDIERRLNEDLQTLNDWSKQWLVDFNPQKTEYMVFNFRKDAQPIYLKFNGELIKKVDDHKHLGVTFSDNYDNYYNTRNRSHYRVPRCRLDIFSKSFFPSSIRTWNLLPLDIRSIQSSPNFKNTIRRNDISFLVPKYYFIGNRIENILHTKLRHRCSPLKADLYRVNLVNDPSCECGCPLEDSIHFFLECPLYINFRNQLFKNIQHLADISIEHILFGTDEITVEQNTILFRNVHSYIRHTKRFFD
ncbi:unnamed protein product [Mytilus edulis]|uniref:Reverse transcriptase zinc-binding domain-containing protein n=1 Tax=Mytilus edulis TaxID=6550 RepID=A0A8S3SGB8_MYTED|nr:unnamed protein product [Mytilus edulis]